jgi:hypothetical protein
MKLVAICFAASLVGACTGADEVDSSDPSLDPSPAVDQKVALLTRDAIRPDATAPIRYHGGAVMTSTHNSVYYIWYGNWDAGAKTILEDFAKTIGGSPYFNINTSYYNRAGTFVTNAVRFGGSIVDNYSQGKSLDDNAIQTIVSNAITSGKLPKNSNAVYFVLTSSDVNETSGMCSQYCGWHYFGAISGSNIKYSFVGNPDRCPSSCEAQTASSPNGNTGADGMASIIAHELEEAVTDPYVSAWYDSSGEENGDKCAWTFGTEQTASNGSKYNVTLGSRQFLIQQNWNAKTQSCALSY